ATRSRWSWPTGPTIQPILSSSIASWSAASTASSARPLCAQASARIPRPETGSKPADQFPHLHALFARLQRRHQRLQGFRRSAIAGIRPLLSHHFNLTVELPLKCIPRLPVNAVLPNIRRGEPAPSGALDSADLKG